MSESIQPTDVAAELQRTLRLLQLTTVALILALFAVVGWVYADSRRQRNEIASVAERSNTALCALRGDLKRRILSSEVFLSTHPKGLLGIPAATIRASIADLRVTVNALAGLECTAKGD